MAQHAGAHHWRQGQRHHGRDQNGDRQRDGKLAEQSPDDIAHKQQRDQHRNQREGQRDNGKSDLARTFSAAAAVFAFRYSARCSRSQRWHHPPRSRWRW